MNERIAMGLVLVLAAFVVGCASVTPACSSCPAQATVDLAAKACEVLEDPLQVELCQLAALASRAQCVVSCTP